MKPYQDKSEESASSYREPTKVSAIMAYATTEGVSTFPVCPRCGITMVREYQNYCDRCGQALDWSGFSYAVILLPKARL